MAQETPIGNLGNSMNQEDSRLVDSILNDLNSGQGQQQQQQQQQQQHQQQHQQQQMAMDGGPPQQMNAEQHREMLEQRQHEMMQQQMMQQQLMMEQQNQQQVNSPESILEKLQSEWKSILIVVVLAVAINTGVVDNLFKMNETTYFLEENGTLNMQAVIIKGLAVGVIYFLFKTFIPI
jgi:hypothetical protein